MIRSLRTGVSGLKSHQIRMDVVGNNIANVNTIAFKRSRAAFNQVMSQEMLGVGRTAGGRGINPSFVGMGVSVGTIDSNFSQGALEHTGVTTDLGLSGAGFFVVEGFGGSSMLTRAGNFTLNSNGELVTATGLGALGWSIDPETGELISAAPEKIRIDREVQAPPSHTNTMRISGNLSADIPVGESNTISTLAYDSQGRRHTLFIEFEKTGNNEWSWEIRDRDGNPFGNGVASFDEAGNLTGDLAATVSWVVGDETIELDLDFGNPDFGLKHYAGSSTATVSDRNGRPAGTLTSFTVNQDGVILMNFTNGHQQKLYQLALATVNNPNGLDEKGENLYGMTTASGDMRLGRAGNEIETAIVAGTLELSNVDLATEFADMIVTQRGFQASARVITTSDEFLQETVNLKR